MPRTLLVSDLHLSAARPEQSALFLRFLREQAPGAASLYVLGDLFEYWIGDDALAAAEGDSLGRDVAAALRAVAGGGTAVRLMHGNRDFLLGPAFCEAAGATLLPDPVVIDIGGVPTLLMHGDTLCTDDADYQAWRQVARSADWQREFLAQPLDARQAAMQALRERSARAIAEKPAAVMDVNAGAVAEAFRRHGTRRLIHGHTHRPARHAHVVDGAPCERWVLPDWYADGGYLVADGLGLRLQRL